MMLGLGLGGLGLGPPQPLGGGGGGAPPPVGQEALVMVLFGQSLNVWRGAATALASGPGYMPAAGVSTAVFPFAATNVEHTPAWADLASVVPIAEPAGGQSPVAGIALGAAGKYARSYIGSAAIGARRLDVLWGGGPRAALHAIGEQLCALARAEGYRPRVHFYWAQGEADATAATGYATYLARATAVAGMLQLAARHWMREPGYTAPIYATYPLQQKEDGADREIKEALRQMARAVPGWVDLGGIYDMPANADRVHPTEAGYVLRGERVGHFIGATSPALEITAVTLSGTTAVVSFNRPITRDASLGVGTALGAAHARDGFEWLDDGTPVPIADVAYGGATATLTLAAAPLAPLAQQVCRIAAQTTTGTLVSGAENLPGSLVRAAGSGWVSAFDPAFTHHVWASPQTFTGVVAP